MTTSRDFDRLMEAFFEDGPAVLTDRVVAAIADDVDRIDVRADLGPWRNPIMLRSMFAAAVVAAVLLGGWAIYAAINQPLPIGPPSGSIAPAPSEDGLAPLPPELQYSFVGPAKPNAGDPRSDRGDISYENGIYRFEIAPNVNIWGTPRLTAEGDLHLVSRVAVLCELGDEGTYPWSVSAGGTILTIGAGSDECDARAQAYPGTYQRAACRDPDGYCLGQLDAVEYVSHVFEPRPRAEGPFRHGAMAFTVPAGWANYADTPDVYGLTPQSAYAGYDSSEEDCYDCPGTRDLVAVLAAPGAATEDCGEEGNVPGIGFGAQDLVEWMVDHPGLVTSEPEEWSVGGRAAVSVTIEGAADWTGTCDSENPFVAVPVFYRVGSYHWALSVGERYHVTLVDLGGGDTVAIMVDTADDEDLESFVETARPIIESFEFPDR